MHFEHTESATASVSVDAIWELWCDPSSWPTWDPPVEAVSLDGDFAAGATGTITLAGGIEAPLAITVVEPGRRYVDELRMGELLISIDHVVEPIPDGVQITVRATITGPGADAIGPMVTAEAPQAIAALIELAAG